MFLTRIPSLIASTVKYRDKAANQGGGIRPAIAVAYLVAAGVAIWITLPPTSRLTGIYGGMIFFTLWVLLLMVLPVPARAVSSDGRGYTSFDRLALVAAILIFGAAPAAWVAGAAVCLFTLLADPRREPFIRRLMRTAANTGMFVLASLAAGYVYYRLGGQIPISDFDVAELGRALLLIVTLQVVNELLFLIMVWPSLSTAERRQPFSLRSIGTELAISLIGMITALAYSDLPRFGFALYAVFIVAVAILFKWVAEVAETRRLRAEEFAAVNRINQAVSAAIDLDNLIERVYLEVRDLVPSASFLLGIYEPDTEELDTRLNVDENTRHPQVKRKLGQGILAWSLQHCESIFIPDTRNGRHPAIEKSITIGRKSISIIVVPILYKNKPIGALSVQDYEPSAFTRHQLRLLEGFASQIAVAIMNTRLIEQLKAQQQMLEASVADRTAELEKTTRSLAETMKQKEALLDRLELENRRDALTGIANRRHLDEFLPHEIQRTKRYGHPLSIAMLDIDHFKTVNDSLGHAMGDQVLRAIANILLTELRGTDFNARYGGEEFVIVFPETTGPEATAACDKLRTLIALHPWSRLAKDLSVTVSFGVSSLEHSEQTEAQLLASADRALYAAKLAGRNQVREAPRGDIPNSASIG